MASLSTPLSKGLHSSTFQITVCTFRGICCVVLVTDGETAQVELRNGRVRPLFRSP